MPGCSKLKKVIVYNDNIDYYHIVPTVYYGDGTIGYNVEVDTEAFRNCSEDLILYGHEGSTTQTYAQQKGIMFEILSSSGQEPPATMGSIHLNKNELTLNENKSETLIVSFLEMPLDTKVIWSSSDERVAIVENGKVTAKNIGNTIITVSTEDGKYKDTCAVSVIKEETPIDPDIVSMTSISLNKSSLSLYVGDTETLVATILPINATDKNLVWSSSNSSIATVENGKITAKAIGSVTITVSNTNGTNKATCNVEVVKKETTSVQNPDNTVVDGKLPKTGIRNFISIVLFIFFIVMTLSYRHYKNLKNI